MEKSGKDKILWGPALGVFSEISTWIAAPVIFAVIVGKALDNRYGTGPLLLLSSAGVAFLISSYGIVSAVKKYAKRIKKEEDKK